MKKPVVGIVEKGRRRCPADNLEVSLRTADRHGCGHGARNDVRAALQHTGVIARCDTRDQCRVTNGPWLQNECKFITDPRLAERAAPPWRVADPGILVVDAVGDAEAV